jgi:hypothetical protein
MRTYESKTGYVRNNVSGECFATPLIYMSCLDDDNTYSDITKDEYEAYVKEQEARYADYER